MQEVLEGGLEALEAGDFQEAQENTMNTLGLMVKEALTAVRDIIEVAPDTVSIKKEAAPIAVQEGMTAYTDQEVMAQAMEVPVHMEGAINQIPPLKCS